MQYIVFFNPKGEEGLEAIRGKLKDKRRRCIYYIKEPFEEKALNKYNIDLIWEEPCPHLSGRVGKMEQFTKSYGLMPDEEMYHVGNNFYAGLPISADSNHREKYGGKKRMRVVLIRKPQDVINGAEDVNAKAMGRTLERFFNGHIIGGITIADVMGNISYPSS